MDKKINRMLNAMERASNHNHAVVKYILDPISNGDMPAEKTCRFYLELAIENCCLINEAYKRLGMPANSVVDIGTYLVLDKEGDNLDMEAKNDDGSRRYLTFCYVEDSGTNEKEVK